MAGAPTKLICPPGFTLVRKTRCRKGRCYSYQYCRRNKKNKQTLLFPLPASTGFIQG